MSWGPRRAGAGQGAAAAVQLLVTLSFLPSVVEAQVSPSDGGAGTPAERPRRWRTGRGWGSGRGPAPDPEGDFWRAERGRGLEPNRHVQETSASRVPCAGDGDARGVMAAKRGRW